jgi:hypothetical protein
MLALLIGSVGGVVTGMLALACGMLLAGVVALAQLVCGKVGRLSWMPVGTYWALGALGVFLAFYASGG